MVQLPYEVLRKRNVFQQSLLPHHFQSHVARSHLLHVLNFRLADNLAEEKQNLCLTLCQRIAFDMVAVIVEVDGKPSAQQLPVPFR